MNKKQKWVFIAFYIVNGLAGLGLIAFGAFNPSINMAISMYLVTLTAFFSYALSHQKKQ
ncbi:MAG: hypothetical protein WC341_14470 [Bacteroidales bacterium]